MPAATACGVENRAPHPCATVWIPRTADPRRANAALLAGVLLAAADFSDKGAIHANNLSTNYALPAHKLALLLGISDRGVRLLLCQLREAGVVDEYRRVDRAMLQDFAGADHHDALPTELLHKGLRPSTLRAAAVLFGEAVQAREFVRSNRERAQLAHVGLQHLRAGMAALVKAGLVRPARVLRRVGGGHHAALQRVSLARPVRIHTSIGMRRAVLQMFDARVQAGVHHQTLRGAVAGEFVTPEKRVAEDFAAPLQKGPAEGFARPMEKGPAVEFATPLKRAGGEELAHLEGAELARREGAEAAVAPSYSRREENHIQGRPHNTPSRGAVSDAEGDPSQEGMREKVIELTTRAAWQFATPARTPHRARGGGDTLKVAPLLRDPKLALERVAKWPTDKAVQQLLVAAGCYVLPKGIAHGRLEAMTGQLIARFGEQAREVVATTTARILARKAVRSVGAVIVCELTRTLREPARVTQSTRPEPRDHSAMHQRQLAEGTQLLHALLAVDAAGQRDLARRVGFWFQSTAAREAGHTLEVVADHAGVPVAQIAAILEQHKPARRFGALAQTATAATA